MLYYIAVKGVVLLTKELPTEFTIDSAESQIRDLIIKDGIHERKIYVMLKTFQGSLYMEKDEFCIMFQSQDGVFKVLNDKMTYKEVQRELKEFTSDDKHKNPRIFKIISFSVSDRDSRWANVCILNTKERYISDQYV